MKADLTRRTHERDKRYARVIHQQGRVPLDADLNEQFERQGELDATRAVDTIGPAGFPKGPSFRVTPSPDQKDLLVAPGTAYVDGVLCESSPAAHRPLSITPPRVIALPALTLGGVALAPAEWVTVFTAPGVTPAVERAYRIRAINRTNRTITLGPGDNLSTDFPGVPASSLRVRRSSSYIFQPDWLRPGGTLWPAPANPDSLTEAELPSINTAQIPAGTYQAYLDVWERHITAIDDPSIREVALGGPDTCTRAKTVWQVKLRALTGTGVDCTIPAAPAPGGLRARAKLPTTVSPCLPSPSAQYRRLENQLYRVEIHGAGTLTGGVPSAGLTFKFSRDNGSVVVRWLGSVSATELQVDTIGRDAALGLASGQWIELLDDRSDHSGLPGTLVQIDTVVGTTVTIKPLTATGPTAFTAFLGNPRIRRWDQVSAAQLDVKRDTTVNDGWLALEDGVQVLFDDGAYKTGDYWTIPARTITGDVEWPLDPDGKPVPRPPEGIIHHRAPLAQVAWSGTAWTAVLDAGGEAIDCRPQFPPLTHICAEDVCVDPDPCGMGASNVQEALEKLCAQQDLPFHNQHLHGWGVVCGLQVNCMSVNSPDPDAREKVLIRTGYAVHPSGHDIKVNSEITYPVVQHATALLGANETLDDIAVSLSIDLGGTIGIEKFDPDHKKTAREVLSGTILLDFVDHCIQPVIDFWRDQTTPDPDEEGDLVGPTRKRLTALLNLIWQFADGQNGAYIYLSGERQPSDEGPNHEDKILREFFEGLRGLLQSETFCAMFADVTFPPYDVFKTAALEPTTVPHPFTIFGKNSHTRVRVHPDGRWAFTCDAVANVPRIGFLNTASWTPGPSKINVFDLDAGRMVAEVEFPIAGAEVKDVAFNPGTSQIYAAAWIGDARADSAVVAGTINGDGTITWSQNQVTCSKKIVTLASGKEPINKLYAAARGAGVCVFDMLALDPNPPMLGAETRATGHLVLVTRNTRDSAGNEGSGGGAVLYAGYHATNNNPVAYDHIVGVDLAPDGTQSNSRTFTLPSNSNMLTNEGHDDIAAVFERAGNTTTSQLYVVAEGRTGGNKGMYVFNSADPAAFPGEVPLEEKTENRIAYNWRSKQIFVTYEDLYKGRQYSTAAAPPVLRPDRHPLQIGAISVAVGDRGRKWYVQNWLSNTITVIPAVYTTGVALQPWESVISETKLAAYRDAVILAFLKMLGRFLQYLKDCFCHLLLVDCPDGTGKVYLADVSFRDGLVYQICNFSRRKYVHTFPLVEYWLSIIPIIPLVKLGVEKFCCSVLTGFFDELEPPSRERTAIVKASTARSGLQWSSARNLGTMVNMARSQITLAGAFGKMSLGESLSRPPAGTAPSATQGLSSAEVIGRSADDVTASATSKGVRVNRVVVADSAASGAGTLVSTTLKTRRVAPGTTVDLITDRSGRVLGYKTVGTADGRSTTDKGTKLDEATARTGPTTTVNRDVLDRLTGEVAALRAELESLKASMPR
jgi:hypothetical protein